MRRLILLLLVLLPAGPVAAQGRYDQYGPVVDVTIADLESGGVAYSGRAIRTRGYLERSQSIDDRTYRLRDNFGNSVAILPVPDIAQEFDSEAITMLGRMVEVTGLFEENTRTGGQNADQLRQAGVIQFWKFLTVPDPNEERLKKARQISIDELTAHPGRHDGRTIRVVGLFRGHNLFNDLPPKSARKRSDWVLQQGEDAIWVTGKKAKGEGWELDPELKRDTGKWIEVTGRVETKDQITYIHAERLILTAAPANLVAKTEPTATPVPRPKVPPVVVFALPLDGDMEVPGNSRFVVQFSKDMDETTFNGHVELRYVSAPRVGVRPLESVTIAYDAGLRALTVDPGDRLGRGTEVELRLLPGIKDIDGLELVPRHGPTPDGAVDSLRFRVGT
jgi:hypothetical protein